MTSSPFLTTKEVADILRCSEKKIYSKAKSIGGYFKFGGSVLFDKERFYKWLKNQTINSRS